mgnify:CR=1 FL=1
MIEVLVVLAVVVIVLGAGAKLVSSGDVSIEINGERTITVPACGKLLQALASNNIFLSSACGGGGTCAQCKCIVESGGGEMLPTEESHFTRREAGEGWRRGVRRCRGGAAREARARATGGTVGGAGTGEGSRETLARGLRGVLGPA